jgi:uncharacterized protein YodC (DUF2158 family)
MSFNIGDVVRLKSGSPLMTVTSEYNPKAIQCEWFERHQAYKQNFPEGALIINKEPTTTDKDLLLLWE